MFHINRLYTRAHRKINRIFERYIPYNKSYKPKGHYNTLSEYVSATGAECKEIYPPEESALKVQDELINTSQKYHPVPKTGIQPAAYVTAVKSGRIYTDTINFAAVISEDNKVIGDISLHIGSTNPADNGIFNQSYFNTPMGLKGNAFHTLIGGSGENNYFHWMIDSLPRLHLLEKAGWLDKIDWFIVPKHNLPYQKDTLRLLNISQTKIVEGHEIQHIQAENLFATTFVRNIEHIPLWACQFLRKKFLPVAQRIIHSPKRIFISRHDSRSRNVKNEQQVMEMLGKYGFKKVVLSDLTFAEQVGLFEHAETIIAPHGAGLTNLVFCKKGANIIELFAKEYTPVLYADLASKVSLNYNYLSSSSHPIARDLRSAMNKDIQVPIIELEKLVKEVLTAEEHVSHEAV
ncbi:glycosyltransferase family 61 protein [Pontibacter sp. H249]|uniref:glycosyltransferase family 61 protein n=1 Tax=Pontibacter sp. H249 TaxID=3133420 RepID=UPI0030BD6BBE